MHHRFVFFLIMLNIFCVSFIYPVQLHKLDPQLRMAIQDRKKTTIHKSLFNEELMSFIIHGSTISEFDFPVQTHTGSMATTRLALSQVLALSELPHIHYIEQSETFSVLLDVSAGDFNISPVWHGELGHIFEGEEVIVGIYDTGIDFRHPDFIDENGYSRILYLWDQTDSQGPAPSGFNYYGTEYLQTEINDEIDGTPTGYIRQTDVHGHGTHVAGIAAGNGTGLGIETPVYIGMAPKADLIVVKGGDGEFDNSQIIDGMNYIFKRAKSLDRPVVVNLSLGSQEGPHDGTSAIEKAISNFLWDPSRAVVVAAGNSGNQKIHAKVDLTEQQNEASVTFDITSNSADEYDFINFDIWYSGSQEIEFSVKTSTGEIIGPVATGKQATWPSVRKMVRIDNAHGGLSPLNNDHHLWFQLSDFRGDVTDDFPQGRWQLTFKGDPGTIHLWIYEMSETIDAAFSDEDAVQSHLIASPGNANFAITVGAHVSRTSHPNLNIEKPVRVTAERGELASFSSPGPTRTGGAKPEMTAPGQKIVAPLSADISSWPGDGNVTPDSLYRGWQGTSMSAPHVTGLVALMFEADPMQTSSDIKTRLIQSCRTDANTGEVWNALWGYGKVDAEAAMTYYTDVKIHEYARKPGQFLLHNYPNPYNASTKIVFSGSKINTDRVLLQIFNIKGQKVFSTLMRVTRHDVAEYEWDVKNMSGEQLPAGVYFYHIRHHKTIFCGKMIYIP